MQGLPSLPYHEWRETRDTLHLWTQIVGKIRLALTPQLNHWWNVPLYVSAHGLTTSAIPIADRCFEIDFDFLDDALRVHADDGRERVVELAPRTVGAPAFEGNVIDREAYSHEVASVGWWPGDPRFERAAFYSYAVPEPTNFALAPILPAQAYYHAPLKGFYLDHEDVRRAADPEAMLLEFCETTYAAAADLGSWPRAELERAPPQPPQAEEHHADVFSSQDPRQHPGANERLRGVPAAGR